MSNVIDNPCQPEVNPGVSVIVFGRRRDALWSLRVNAVRLGSKALPGGGRIGGASGWSAPDSAGREWLRLT